MATDCETKLAEAKQALHELLTGKSSVEVWDGDFRVKYNTAEIDKLQAYVNTLEAQCGSTAGTSAATRRPLTFRFC